MYPEKSDADRDGCTRLSTTLMDGEKGCSGEGNLNGYQRPGRGYYGLGGIRLFRVLRILVFLSARSTRVRNTRAESVVPLSKQRAVNTLPHFFNQI